MDSFEWNKIFGAVLGTVLFVVALNLLVGGLMTPEKSDKPGMEVAVAEDHGAGPTTGPVEELKPDWGTVLAAADIAAGEKTHIRCQQCHDFAKGGPDKIGPNLYGVVGGPHAHAPAYAYSPALSGMKDKTWGYDELDAFIKNPKGAVPGTKMAFAGLSKQTDRINLIAYLRSLSDSPLAIPAPNPVATAPATPTDGAAEPPAGQLQGPAPETTPEGTTPAAPGTATPPAGAPAPAAPAPATAPPAAPAKPGH
ncbi:MAG: cytochrome c family protein [Micropepsaceae bacterium]